VASMSKRTKTTAVAASSSLDLICGLCDESYNDTTRVPLNLGCGHTYCAKCLGKMVETKGRGASARQQLVCPMDSSVTPLAARDNVLSLPKNYPLAELVAAAGGAAAAALPAPAAAVAPPPIAISGVVPACEVCEEPHDASHRCIECQQHMCDLMTKNHRRLSMTMTHRVVSLAELRADPTLAEATVVQVCKAHGEPLKLFDMPCCQLLCALCVVDHVGHRVLPMAEAATACRADLGEWSQRLDVWAARAKLSSTAADQRFADIEKARASESAKINAACNKVHHLARQSFISFWYNVVMRLVFFSSHRWLPPLKPVVTGS
jgi:hypothetical protein